MASANPNRLPHQLQHDHQSFLPVPSSVRQQQEASVLPAIAALPWCLPATPASSQSEAKKKEHRHRPTLFHWQTQHIPLHHRTLREDCRTTTTTPPSTLRSALSHIITTPQALFPTYVKHLHSLSAPGAGSRLFRCLARIRAALRRPDLTEDPLALRAHRHHRELIPPPPPLPAPARS
jgi:hypothetical protein